VEHYHHGTFVLIHDLHDIERLRVHVNPELVLTPADDDPYRRLRSLRQFVKVKVRTGHSINRCLYLRCTAGAWTRYLEMLVGMIEPPLNLWSEQVDGAC
jgi:hypothetical protein